MIVPPQEMSIFTRRPHYKPFEYPEATAFWKAIYNSVWTVEEYGDFTGDVQDYHVHLTHPEREAIRRALLAISQIEANVKLFWGKLHEHFPKPEIIEVGLVFSSNEVVHASSYSKLLEVLGFNDDFKHVLEVPAIQSRVAYLEKYLKPTKGDRDYALTLALFSVFVEFVSLFSQFLVIKSFNKHKNVLKDVDNVVQATIADERVHAEFGMWLIDRIRDENPEWFDADFKAVVTTACAKALEAEETIVDWMLEEGDLPYLDRASLKAFTRDRFNQALRRFGCDLVFDLDESLLPQFQWFQEELVGEARADFWYKRPTTYSRGLQSITAQDLL